MRRMALASFLAASLVCGFLTARPALGQVCDATLDTSFNPAGSGLNRMIGDTLTEESVIGCSVDQGTECVFDDLLIVRDVSGGVNNPPNAAGLLAKSSPMNVSGSCCTEAGGCSIIFPVVGNNTCDPDNPDGNCCTGSGNVGDPYVCGGACTLGTDCEVRRRGGISFDSEIGLADGESCTLEWDVDIQALSQDGTPNTITQVTGESLAEIFAVCDVGCNVADKDDPSCLASGGEDTLLITLRQDGDGESDNYKCYSAKPEPGTGFVSREVVLTDQFSGDTVATVVTPFELCTPVRKEGLESPDEETDEILNDPDAPHLMCYKLENPAIGPDVLLRDTDQFGTLTHRVGNAVVLCLPALKSCEERAEEQQVEAVCSLADVEAQQAHLNCYNAFDEEQPFGQCSETTQVCSTSGECPEGEECEMLSEAIPFDINGQLPPAALDLTDQFGTTTSVVKETTFHCNPLDSKTVDFGQTETFDPLFFPEVPFPVPADVTDDQEIHFRCYDIDDEEKPEAFAEDPRNRLVRVVDQFNVAGAPIQLGVGTRLCEPAVKELLEEVKVEQGGSCGLLGIEAALGLVALGWLRRRARRA